MELQEVERNCCEEYLTAFEVLIGDRRSASTFQGVIEGIIGAESLRTSQIARFSPSLGEPEVRR
jgi:hypothetical protein